MAEAKSAEKPGFGERMRARAKGFGRMAQYLREVRNELKKVHWPDRKQLMTYTGVVLVSVGILAVLIWIVDSGLSYAVNLLIGS